MILKYTQTQYLDTTKKMAESSLSILVDYDPETETVEQTMGAMLYNHIHNVSTDLTALLSEQFGSPLDSMIDSINWPEVYSETMAGKKEVA